MDTCSELEIFKIYVLYTSVHESDPKRDPRLPHCSSSSAIVYDSVVPDNSIGYKVGIIPISETHVIFGHSFFHVKVFTLTCNYF